MLMLCITLQTYYVTDTVAILIPTRYATYLLFLANMWMHIVCIVHMPIYMYYTIPCHMPYCMPTIIQNLFRESREAMKISAFVPRFFLFKPVLQCTISSRLQSNFVAAAGFTPNLQNSDFVKQKLFLLENGRYLTYDDINRLSG